MFSGALRIQHTSNFRNKTEHFTHSLKLHNEAKQTFQIQISSISKYVSISSCVNKQKNDTLKTLKGYCLLIIPQNFHTQIFPFGKFPSQKVMKNRIQTQSLLLL